MCSPPASAQRPVAKLTRALLCVIAYVAAACLRSRDDAVIAPGSVVRPSAALPLEVAASTALARSREHPEYGRVAETRVTLRNLSKAPLQLTLRTPCTVFVRVFASAARTGSHAWSLGGNPGGCKWFPVPRTIAPNAVDTLRSSVPVAAILGDSLPAGHVYYFSALIVISELPGQQIELPAGALRLKR
jgi:hypothetical protein